MEKLNNLWDKLPKELKIPFYHAGAWALAYIAEILLSLDPIDWQVAIRVLLGNMIIVFLRESQKRYHAKNNEKTGVAI